MKTNNCENKLVSIIITVYNAEKYIKKCLESIVEQTYKNIEVVIVNDGANDGSEAICKEYVNRYSNMSYYYQSNQGQQEAQYNGLKYSKGDFVIFVDSDDWIDANMIEELVSNIRNHDLATSGYIAEYKNSSCKVFDAIEEGVYKTDFEYKYILDNFFIYKKERTKGLLNNKACKLFKRDKALNAMVMSKIGITLEEDFLFVLCYLLDARSINVSHNCYYHYRQSEDSISHSYISDYLSQREKIYKNVIDLLVIHGKEYLISEYQKRFYYDIVCSLPNYMKFKNVNMNYLKYFPINLEKCIGKKIGIYGFGKRGVAIYEWIKKSHDKIVITEIIDMLKKQQRIDNYVIKSIENADLEECDYIVITINDKNVCNNVKGKLIEYGFNSEKIIVLETMNVLEGIF